jgi:tryptophan 2,3-dioxygenase
MAGTDYASYLRIDELLRLQRPLTPAAHDEMLFIVVHQVYELWFKLMLGEIDLVVTELLAGRPQRAVPPLRRALAVDELLVAQLRLLETMSPEGFLEFRDPLEPASGLQSGQFRAIEFAGGLRDAARLDDPALSDHDRGELRRRMDTPTLYDALRECMTLHGLAMPAGDDTRAVDARMRSLAALYRDHATAERALLHQVCELLLDHDEAMSRWRFQHTLMAAREIGARPGTGGSRGVEYLRTTTARRFFPELWELRTRL